MVTPMAFESSNRSAHTPSGDPGAPANEPRPRTDLWDEFPELGVAVKEALRSYAANTQLALRADWRRWRGWCAAQMPARQCFPASIDDVVTYTLVCSPATPTDGRGVTGLASTSKDEEVRTASTLQRYLHTLGAMHRLSGLADPTKTPEVAAARRRVTRGRGGKRQKTGLNRTHLETMLCVLGTSLWDLRARALLLTAYCTLARSAEVVALEVADLRTGERGDGYAIVRKSKGDQEGHGSHRYLAAPAVTALQAWLSAASIKDGPVFRRIHRHGGVTPKAIGPPEMARIIQAVIRRLPLSKRPVGAFAGHSTRIGAAQDLVASGQDLLSVMQAGGWKDPKMPARYTEHLAAMRGGMARLWRTPASGALASAAIGLIGPVGFSFTPED
jgi:site-specific recombinase XerD